MNGILDVDKILSKPLNDPASRVTRIAAPVASPAKCVLCGKYKHPNGFAAFDNLDFDFYGTLYFCGDCVGDIARPFGFLGRPELEAIIEAYRGQQEELRVLREAVVNLENLVDAYTAIRGPVSVSSSTISSGHVTTIHVDAGTEEAPTGTDGSVTSGELPISDGEQQTDERSDESGRNDVHDSTIDHTKLAELGIDLS